MFSIFYSRPNMAQLKFKTIHKWKKNSHSWYFAMEGRRKCKLREKVRIEWNNVKFQCETKKGKYRKMEKKKDDRCIFFII